MTRDALPSFLRGTGMTMIFVAAIIAFVIANQDAKQNRAAHETRDAAAHHETIVDDVLGNRWFDLMSLLGTGVFAASFYSEAWLRLRASKKN